MLFLLQFYDGGFESSDRLGKFCGNIRPPTVTSSSNVLLVKFHSDGSVNKLGFEATVTHSKGKLLFIGLNGETLKYCECFPHVATLQHCYQN